MTAVGLLGILLSLCAFPFAMVERSRVRVAVFFLAMLAQIATGVIYYIWAQTTSADTLLYYFDPHGMVQDPVKFGTYFVVHLVQTLRGWIGGSYLDYFLIFQAIGFWGIAFLMRTFEEVYQELGIEQPRWTYAIFFLPGLHFWTSAIGKDAPLFFAASLALWSAMRLRSRLIPFGFAVFVMLLFRPHIAFIAITAMSIATLLDRRTRVYAKLFLLGLAFAGSIPVAAALKESFTVDVTSSESIEEFFETQSEVTSKIGGTTAVHGASLPIRFLSLMFRPMFLDAREAFGVIASIENLFIVFMVWTLLRRIKDVARLFRRVFFLRFGITFALILILLLSIVYYNVGLGLRQKTMFMPALLALFASVVAITRAPRFVPLHTADSAARHALYRETAPKALPADR